jgi:nucleotide-binding universal stress UspA family protein
VLTGEPADRIVAYAVEQSCDLIVMPTHAYGRFRRFLLGSVTSKVLHDADCPVRTGVHHQDAPFSDEAIIRSIVCAIDLSPNCVPVIRWAQNLARCSEAALKVIHAEPAVDETSDNTGEIELRHHLFRRAEAKFEGWCGPAGLKIAVEHHGGSLAQVVREAALRERADLVVIVRGHAKGILGRLRTGAYGIIRDSPCPFLAFDEPRKPPLRTPVEPCAKIGLLSALVVQRSRMEAYEKNSQDSVDGFGGVDKFVRDFTRAGTKPGRDHNGLEWIPAGSIDSKNRRPQRPDYAGQWNRIQDQTDLGRRRRTCRTSQ